MNDQDFQQQLDEQQKALTQIYQSVEKTRKMILWSGIATALTFILPLIIVMFMFPKIIGTFTSSMNVLNDTNTVKIQKNSIESLSDSLNILKSLGF